MKRVSKGLVVVAVLVFFGLMAVIPQMALAEEPTVNGPNENEYWLGGFYYENAALAPTIIEPVGRYIMIRFDPCNVIVDWFVPRDEYQPDETPNGELGEPWECDHPPDEDPDENEEDGNGDGGIWHPTYKGVPGYRW